MTLYQKFLNEEIEGGENVENVLVAKEKLSKKKEEVIEKKRIARLALESVSSEEEKIEGREEKIENQKMASEPDQKKSLEIERREVEDRRREIEEKRWKLEEELREIEKEEREIALIAKRGEETEDRITEINSELHRLEALEKEEKESFIEAPEEEKVPDEKSAEAPKKESYAISLSSEPEDGGTVSGKGDYAPGEKVYVLATPGKGFSFVNWTEDEVEVGDNVEHIFKAEKDRHLVANFREKEAVATAKKKLEPSSQPSISVKQEEIITETPQKEEVVSDIDLVKEFIGRNSETSDLDLKKIEESKEFFDFMLERAKEEKEQSKDEKNN